MTTRKVSPEFKQEVKSTLHWTLPVADDSSISTTEVAWNLFTNLLNEGIQGGQLQTNPISSTYSLVYTAANAYYGGVLAPNGDIHFVPRSANRGQKISAAGVVSTYSLVYTTTTAYAGGVLAPNGDIHFVPTSAVVGQKISAAGVVSTYSLVYTATNAYVSGVLAPNGDIHFVPYYANRGQIIHTGAALPFDIGVCVSAWLNKF